MLAYVFKGVKYHLSPNNIYNISIGKYVRSYNGQSKCLFIYL